MAETRGTILVVDDDPATVELLSEYLGGRRLAVARAHNLDDAYNHRTTRYRNYRTTRYPNYRSGHKYGRDTRHGGAGKR